MKTHITHLNQIKDAFSHFPFYILILYIGHFLSCTGEKNSDVLARIGDVEISVEEFLNRSELTPRPFYCRSDSEQDKIIILNTLIIEKLYALEERRNGTLLEKPLFKAHIRGIKEQYMRDELFRQMAITEADLDSNEKATAFKLAGYIYDVAFYRFDTKTAVAIEEYLRANPDKKDSIFTTLGDPEKASRHRLKFNDPEYPSLHHSFYLKEWNKGDIVGPVKLRETQYMILRIENVLYEPAMSQTEVVTRKKGVKEKLVEKHTNYRWNTFTANLMKNKKIQFLPEITIKVAELWARHFSRDEKVVQVAGEPDENFGKFVQEIELLVEEPMFKIDEKIWTVADFRQALLSHPLVFRKADMIPSEYLEQFKLAVADLIQDSYITNEAYAQKIDQSLTVRRKVAMWEDAYLALNHSSRLIESNRAEMEAKQITENYHSLIDPYIMDLKNKYESQIKINVEAFNNIKLTHTDFVSVQQFVPYQAIVPHFPQLTRADQLGIGSMLN